MIDGVNPGSIGTLQQWQMRFYGSVGTDVPVSSIVPTRTVAPLSPLTRSTQVPVQSTTSWAKKEYVSVLFILILLL